jgi:hypothetical protein
MLEKLNGKKTYVVSILIGLGAAAVSMGVTIPEWVWIALGALGLGAVRSAINNLGK